MLSIFLETNKVVVLRLEISLLIAVFIIYPGPEGAKIAGQGRVSPPWVNGNSLFTRNRLF